MAKSTAAEKRDLAALRVEYGKRKLLEKDVDRDPIRQLIQWMDEAIAAKVDEPSGMTLATCENNRPSARIMLLKTIEEKGLVFATNYHSRKGRQLEANPNAALLLWWPKLEREVRVEGTMAKVSREESCRMFDARPPASRLGAAASDQSEVIASREVLEKRMAELVKKYPRGDVPCPEHWGGYRLTPRLFEFWQGGRDRLHDRIEYVREKGRWGIRRLSP
jgi:pyridoxamine 5'-phosphate oxidase